MTVAAVTLWGSRIAAVSIAAGARYATFQYDPAFVRGGVQVAPVQMPLREQPYRFPGLPQDAFSGLPGLLADSLPDRWGTALVNAWLASHVRAIMGSPTRRAGARWSTRTGRWPSRPASR